LALRQIEWVNGDSGNLNPAMRNGIIKVKKAVQYGAIIRNCTWR